MKAYIYFSGDLSVGIQSYWYEMEIPQASIEQPEDRMFTRQQIKTLYEELDGEFKCVVSFSDEKLTQN
jgi:hypothetical protein